MIGTIVNTATIVTGSIVGSVLKKGIKPQYQDALFHAMGLAAAMLGINAVTSNLSKSNYPVLFIASLAIGSLLGHMLDLQTRFDRLVEKIRKRGDSGKKKKGKSGEKGQETETKRLSEGLSTGLLLYCIGTLSILGPVQSALLGDHTYLYTNATLDLVTSMVLASTYGIGMALAAPVLFCWQGAIYLLAVCFGSVITPDMMTELSIVGGILITASGLSILKIKEFKTLNMLPSLVIPIVFLLISGLF